MSLHIIVRAFFNKKKMREKIIKILAKQLEDTFPNEGHNKQDSKKGEAIKLIIKANLMQHVSTLSKNWNSKADDEFVISKLIALQQISSIIIHTLNKDSTISTDDTQWGQRLNEYVKQDSIEIIKKLNLFSYLSNYNVKDGKELLKFAMKHSDTDYSDMPEVYNLLEELTNEPNYNL